MQADNKVFEELKELVEAEKLSVKMDISSREAILDLREAGQRWQALFPDLFPKTFFGIFSDTFPRVTIHVFLDEKEPWFEARLPDGSLIGFDLVKHGTGWRLDIANIWLEKHGVSRSPGIVYNVIAFAEKLGIDRVTMTSTRQGSYKFAKFGFPCVPREVKNLARERLDIIRSQLPDDQQRAIEDLLGSNDPDAVRRLANLPYRVTLTQTLWDHVQQELVDLFDFNSSDSNEHPAFEKTVGASIPVGEALLVDNAWHIDMPLADFKRRVQAVLVEPLVRKR